MYKKQTYKRITDPDRDSDNVDNDSFNYMTKRGTDCYILMYVLQSDEDCGQGQSQL